MTTNELLLNPVRMRIIQLLGTDGTATVADLAEKIDDIPRTTLYRHINVLAESGVITIETETKIRGTYERKYKLDFLALQTLTFDEDAQNNVFPFLTNMLQEFRESHLDFSNSSMTEWIFHSANTYLLTDLEFEQMTEECHEVMSRYLNLRPAEGRRLRSISLISAHIEENTSKLAVNE